MHRHAFEPVDLEHDNRRIVPARHALNPILLDTPVITSDGSRASVFLTPASAAIERFMPLVVAGSSGVFLLGSFLASQLGAPAPLANLMILCAFSIAAIPAIASVWETISRFRIDIDALMLLGAGLAALIGNPMEGALLLFLFALSGALEEYSLDRTQAAIVALHNLMPTEAIVLTESGTERRSLKRVEAGQRVLVRPGDKVPLDGTVMEGSSSVNESAITGESLPRDKNPNDPVYAGTTNIQGRLVVTVNKTANDTTLARILQLVTEARHQRAGAQRLIDRIGPTYSALVVIGSIVAGVTLHVVGGLSGHDAVYRAIAFLIVCSPCALVIATPVAYLSAIAAAARRGVLIKGGVYLESLARAKAIVFDKTGTLTTGQVRLTDVIAPPGVTEDDALRLAGALESSSSHPLAAAVMTRLAENRLQPFDVDDLTSVPGHGISAKSNNRRVWIGRPRSAREHIDADHREAFDESVHSVRRTGKAASALVIDGMPGVLVFEDSLRENAAETVKRLRAAGIQRIEMLTGDHQLVAETIASKLCIDGFQADLMPEDKLTATKRLRAERGPVVMVGDGVNDAPALADADVGIAVGSIGADVALEAADIVLMNNSLDGVAWLHAHAKRTSRIVRQNLALAIGVIAVLSAFALAGRVPLPLAVIGHEGSTVLVVLNGLRLLRNVEPKRSA